MIQSTVKILLIILTLVLLGQPAAVPYSTSPTLAKYDHFLFPPNRPDFVLLRRSQLAAPVKGQDVFVPAGPTDELAQQTAAMLSDPARYPYIALRLHQFAKNYLANNNIIPTSTALNEPTYLFLSDRRGGFPGQNFWLENPKGTLQEMKGVSYVDLQFAADELAGHNFGDVDQIFPHELGHIFLHELAGQPKHTFTSNVHYSTVRSDPWTAFDEGWATHFQPAALNHNPNKSIQARRQQPLPSLETKWYGRFAHEQAKGCYLCPANLAFLGWHGQNEQHLRDGAVRENHFIHQVTLPAALTSDQRPPYEALLYRDVIPPGPAGPLKNGAQMLASEGVLATLFYRLAVDPRLQTSYCEPAFYEQFLLPGQQVRWNALTPSDLFTPQENVYLKLFDTLARHVTADAEQLSMPAIQLINGYAQEFPAEAEFVYDIFLEVTQGVTVAPPGKNPAHLAGLRKQLVQGNIQLDANLGPQLWLSNRDHEGGFGVFRYLGLFNPVHNFDLNAADASDLRTIPGVSAALAKRIVTVREEQGYFNSLDDLGRVEGMSPELLARFQSMQIHMRDYLAQQDTATQGDTAFAQYLVPILILSYAIPALFQIIRLLLVAALTYSLVQWVAGAGAPISRKQRIWRYFDQGLCTAFVALLASLTVYLAGWPVNPFSMALLALPIWGAGLMWRRWCGRANNVRQLSGSLAAWLVVLAITGAMY